MMYAIIITINNKNNINNSLFVLRNFSKDLELPPTNAINPPVKPCSVLLVIGIPLDSASILVVVRLFAGISEIVPVFSAKISADVSPVDFLDNFLYRKKANPIIAIKTIIPIIIFIKFPPPNKSPKILPPFASAAALLAIFDTTSCVALI
ncbi:putative ORFan [Cotonvirus japonicus]|uniref:ORFan n=1 Tax=Cotonvirus japonicus TaxID=2811091 RepID=A0ABM7NSX7_9VIRU|nr:putative ORFan [Cotonvirus japonicus]BCS83262.1 putative ORFan [Cotonvirus japonicus]